jgi:amino acid transporter
MPSPRWTGSMSELIESPRSARLKRVVVGRPMASAELDETLLPKWLALPIFASDPLSSVAYATEAALVVLVTASATAAHLAFPTSLAIATLLAVVVLSYRQTVLVYESSGGAYIVAKENLGRIPSLVAAAALLTDYVLTVAVSVAAGVLALTSAVTGLLGHELTLSLICVVVIALANLRGVKEVGSLFALPTYAFVSSIFALIGVGVTRCAVSGCPQAVVPHPLTAGTGVITTFVVLRAFASGSTALTGVEAIANGVNAFRRRTGETRPRRSASSAQSRSRCSSACRGSRCTCTRCRPRAARRRCCRRSRAPRSRRPRRSGSCTGSSRC